MIPRCDGCRFWENPARTDRHREGECRRHAPIAVPAGPHDRYPRSVWPTTWEYDGCGDWQRRVEADEPEQIDT